MADKKPPTLSAIIEQVLAQVQGPMPVDEFAQRVLAIYPSKAKNPLTSLRSTLRLEYTGQNLAFLDRHTIVPLRLALQGVRFRIPVTRQEASRGVLCMDPGFHGFRREELAPGDMQLLDAAGHPLATRVVTLKQQGIGLLRLFSNESPAFDLGNWYRTQLVRRHDSVLVTIEDWQRGRFRIEHEPASQRRQPDIERQNQALADLLFDMLEATRDERLYTHRAIPTAYARLAEARGYPGDHWTEVIAHDARMQWDGFAITYGDVRSPFEAMLSLAGRAEHVPPQESYTPTQARQVYRFTAVLWERPQLWRRLEIQGGQTLADFDVILRQAFRHDRGDHLGGFWRLMRRGKSQRFREVD